MSKDNFIIQIPKEHKKSVKRFEILLKLSDLRTTQIKYGKMIQECKDKIKKIQELKAEEQLILDETTQEINNLLDTIEVK